MIAASYGLEESNQFIPCVATPYPTLPLGTLPPMINGIWKGPPKAAQVSSQLVRAS